MDGKVRGACSMKNLCIVLAIAAIMSIPGSMVIPQAFAGPTATSIGSVTVIGACEVVTSGGMAYLNLSPLSGASAEQTVNLSNSGNLASLTGVSGTDWDQASPATPVEMLVGTTHYSETSNNSQAGYDGKLVLTGSSVTLSDVLAQGDFDTFWQLEILLQGGSSGFEGALVQTVTFDFSCIQ